MLGAVLALLAFGLVLTTNAAAIAWSFAALAIALAYPYAKRFVSMPQAVLGVAFSFGIPMAFAPCRRAGAAARLGAAAGQPVLGAGLRHRVRDGRPRRRPADRHEDLGDHARARRRGGGDGSATRGYLAIWGAGAGGPHAAGW